MDEIDKILYKLGYCDSDPNKRKEFEGYVAEAVEFMQDCGVAKEATSSATAYVIKNIWADCRDRGDENSIVKKEGLIVSLISQLRRRKK